MRRRLKVDTDFNAANERMQEAIELLSDVNRSLKQIEAGRVVSNREAKAELRKRFAS
jgi:hypothetical protein